MVDADVGDVLLCGRKKRRIFVASGGIRCLSGVAVSPSPATSKVKRVPQSESKSDDASCTYLITTSRGDKCYLEGSKVSALVTGYPSPTSLGSVHLTIRPASACQAHEFSTAITPPDPWSSPPSPPETPARDLRLLPGSKQDNDQGYRVSSGYRAGMWPTTLHSLPEYSVLDDECKPATGAAFAKLFLAGSPSGIRLANCGT
ncbi:uncharacterized protein BDZ83DRAFT_765560 [Colletotrichum acutatum]|uniref:Uncharacterized protein n=1 Tax=Glomerella acutata TaxID=27357 RepID=A0AAD8UWX5_GLOAC|nr:uncharacterized protein BDZ83DRAFT_765560 [Colletotrichum acutatum]KAK1728619.1 hypothetical protein BDZ83DRAFT_765560 [Colletotrichum acutatum]